MHCLVRAVVQSEFEVFFKSSPNLSDNHWPTIQSTKKNLHADLGNIAVSTAYLGIDFGIHLGIFVCGFKKRIFAEPESLAILHIREEDVSPIENCVYGLLKVRIRVDGVLDSQQIGEAKLIAVVHSASNEGA